MRALLEASFRAAVAAADPLEILGRHLPPPPRGRTFVAAAGKAAASMALAVEKGFSSNVEGIAITRYGHGLPTQRIRVVEAGHPVPDEAGEKRQLKFSSRSRNWERRTYCWRFSPEAVQAFSHCRHRAFQFRG